jgi:hypothetical protein
MCAINSGHILILIWKFLKVFLISSVVVQFLTFNRVQLRFSFWYSTEFSGVSVYSSVQFSWCSDLTICSIWAYKKTTIRVVSTTNIVKIVWAHRTNFRNSAGFSWDSVQTETCWAHRSNIMNPCWISRQIYLNINWTVHNTAEWNCTDESSVGNLQA